MHYINRIIVFGAGAQPRSRRRGSVFIQMIQFLYKKSRFFNRKRRFFKRERRLFHDYSIENEDSSIEK